MSRAIQAVVFDLDDTLYPERMYALGGIAAVAKSLVDTFGDAATTLARMQALFDSANRFRVFDTFLSEKGMANRGDVRDRMVEIYREHAPSLSLHPDTEAALDRLKKNYRLGLLTDGRVSGQRRKIEALRLTDRFDTIILTGEHGDGAGKPHPKCFELMAQKLDVPHQSCAYVGDNPSKDFVAPNALGWRSIWLRRKEGLYREAPFASNGKPTHVINTLAELDAELL